MFQSPVVLVEVCAILSLFLHVTVVPLDTVKLEGTNEEYVMVTVFEEPPGFVSTAVSSLQLHVNKIPTAKTDTIYKAFFRLISSTPLY